MAEPNKLSCGRRTRPMFARIPLKEALQYADALRRVAHARPKPRGVVLPPVLNSSARRGWVRAGAVRQFGLMEGNAHAYRAGELRGSGGPFWLVTRCRREPQGPFVLAPVARRGVRIRSQPASPRYWWSPFLLSAEQRQFSGITATFRTNAPGTPDLAYFEDSDSVNSSQTAFFELSGKTGHHPGG